jgi:ABC-type amino acid transport substrate-binding protein
MRTLLFSLLVLLFGLLSSAQAQEYTVGVEDLDYFPAYAMRNKEYVGAAREILDRFAQKQGITFSYRALPVLRLTGYFVEGKVDFKFPDNANWAGDAKAGKAIVYSGAVFGYTDGVMVLPGRKGNGLDGFKTLGTVRGFTAWDFLGLVKSKQVEIREANSLDSLILQAINNRVDGGYFNVSVAEYFLANNLKQPGALVFDDSLPHTNSFYTLSSIKNPEIIEKFNQFLAEETTWLAELKKKYGLR